MLDGQEIDFLSNKNISYQYCSIDKIGNVVPNDTDGGFTTNRGIYLLDSIDIVKQKYGNAHVFSFCIDIDPLYYNMGLFEDSNKGILESCRYYMVYSLNNKQQIVFYFDADQELIMVTYYHLIAYDDTVSSAYPELRKGSKGVKVENLQLRLSAFGFYTQGIDGDYGNGTAKAIERFQTLNGLPVNGVASTDLQELLYSDKAKSLINKDNRNKFIAQGTPLSLFLFPSLHGYDENEYEIDNPHRNGDYVYATAYKGNKTFPICYFVEDNTVYSVSVIEKKIGDIKKSDYQDCVIGMAQALNHKATSEEVIDALNLAIKNPDVCVMTISGNMGLKYSLDGSLTIIY